MKDRKRTGVRPTKEELSALYEEDGLSLSGLSSHYGVRIGVLARWMDEYGLSIPIAKGRYVPPTPPREELSALYESDGLSLLELASHYETSKFSVIRWMDEYDIPRKSRFREKKAFPSKEEVHELYEVQGVSIEEISKLSGVSKTTVRRRMEEYGIKRVRRVLVHTPPPREDLVEMYVTNGMTFERLGAFLGVSSHTATRWVDAYGIPRRGR